MTGEIGFSACGRFFMRLTLIIASAIVVVLLTYAQLVQLGEDTPHTVTFDQSVAAPVHVQLAAAKSN